MNNGSGSFVWDPQKETENIRKHGIDFFTAAKAFKDPKRKIYVGSKHDAREHRRGENTMKKTTRQDMPIGRLTRIKDVLPPPDELIVPQESVKVTLSLSRSSINFFKRQAQRCHTKYQRMIRQLVDMYAARYSSA